MALCQGGVVGATPQSRQVAIERGGGLRQRTQLSALYGHAPPQPQRLVNSPNKPTGIEVLHTFSRAIQSMQAAVLASEAFRLAKGARH